MFPVRYELNLYINLLRNLGDEKGSFKYETVKYGHENKGTRTQETLRWRGPVACTKNRPVISSERALHKSRTEIVKK
jgi:hypothetical protein